MVFWQKKANAEIGKMLQKYKYVVPENIKEHLKETKGKMDSLDLKIAVASKGLGSDSLIKQVFNGVRFMIKYK